MCGIAALFSHRIESAAAIVHMADTVRHRGPDDEGFLAVTAQKKLSYFGGKDTPSQCMTPAQRNKFSYLPESKISAHSFDSFNKAGDAVVAALGHRRLSIIDTSPAGHQPMVFQNRLAVVFNGEIYNHIEIRQELEARGRRFVSQSDTEVILQAYDEWGVACLAKFNGMFAFVLYDIAKDDVFAARDRFGVKPLYYYRSGETIAFASEIKQFTVLPGFTAQLNRRRGYDFLVYGMHEHTEETFFEDVHLIGPGSYYYGSRAELLRPGKQLAIQKWYIFPVDKKFRGSFADAAHEFHALLKDSIRLRLRADVPVGSCLSGGLDSSSIVCVMNELLREQGAHSLQKTFSACAKEKAFDEREFIDAVVKHTGVQGHYVYPQLTDLFKISDQLLWHQDQPYGSTSIFAQWNVFQLAHKHNVKVMLDGQGADEQLGGYAAFFMPWLSSLVRSFRWLKLVKEAHALNRIHGVNIGRLSWFAANTLLPMPVRRYLKKKLRGVTMAPDWLNMQRMGFEPYDLHRELGVTTSYSIRELSHTMLTGSNLQMLLHYEDRDSMAHSVESRVPFLDYRLVEHVYSLPDSYKIHNGQTKYVLREGLKDVLPREIYNRNSKLGFATPEEVWVRNDAPDVFRKRMKRAVEVADGLIGPQIMQVLDNQISGKARFDFLPWRVISFADWIRVFGVKI
ncbi:MAG: asparagine synthase (glutamine-hydrolyzing) [Flavobacteriales bacterium]|nr:asparagine synthase (glutamine-hydrolyzing) [Flavobacteriales bacterium]